MKKCKPEGTLQALDLLTRVEEILRSNDRIVYDVHRVLSMLVESGLVLPPDLVSKLDGLRERLKSIQASVSARTKLLAIVDITISGAHATDPGDFTECVAVGNGNGFDCSGVLLTSDWVLTAEHCRGAEKIFVGTDVNDKKSGGSYTVKSPGEASGLLRLYKLNDSDRPAVTKATLGPSCALKVGASVIVIGFGGYNISRASYGRQRCAVFDITSANGLTATSVTVTADGKYVSGICPGDSGGPCELFDASNNRFLIGVTEEKGTVDCRTGAVLTHIRPEDADWIDKVTGEKFARACP